MSDFAILNKHRARLVTPTVPPQYISTDEDGFNGMFRIPHNGSTIRCLASDGLGWQHVSVSVEYDNRPPRWEIMCMVKELFWNDDEWVVQFHPPKSEYVNHHPGCLHLWRYTGGQFEQPTPHHILVGPKKAQART